MDLYERLGVRRSAGGAEIRRAWQRVARALHPAVNPGDPVAAERYREAARAFEILTDPQRRAAYDRGELSAEPVAPRVEGGFEGFDFEARVRAETVGFRDIFEHQQPGGVSLAGEELEQSTRVSFEESLHGTSRRVHLVRFEPCAECRAAGEVAMPPVTCPRCGGSGIVRGSRGHMIFSRPCRECDGRGEKRHRACPRCHGEGRSLTSEWLEVRIPPGVDNGAKVRLPGGGNAGRRGGPPSDFVLTVEVDQHPRYRREGADLYCSVPVGMVQAAMGGHVEVETPEGRVTIEVPAGTQTGQRFRLRKRGVPRLDGGGRGDLWAIAEVVIPAVTDDRGRSLLRELSQVLPEG
jgi:molecular chaperone DnaJ